MNIVLETVTPKLAEAWINANKSNRKLREGLVEKYACDMRAGKWTQCPEPISFYADGDLADGQHRLFAIIESDTTQEFPIARGLSREAGLNINTGAGRHPHRQRADLRRRHVFVADADRRGQSDRVRLAAVDRQGHQQR